MLTTIMSEVLPTPALLCLTGPEIPGLRAFTASAGWQPRLWLASAWPPPRTYKDPVLGFSLEYDPTWRLEVRNGAGRSILLEKEGYEFQMQLQRRPTVSGECNGLLEPAQLTLYWKYPLGQAEVWRAKAEAGRVNGDNDDQHSVIDIIVPTELWDKPDSNGAVGEYTCAPAINDYIVRISYLLPVSAEDLKAGQFNPARLAEMDYILTSLTWK
jgi:hypothetical protein